MRFSDLPYPSLSSAGWWSFDHAARVAAERQRASGPAGVPQSPARRRARGALRWLTRRPS